MPPDRQIVTLSGIGNLTDGQQFVYNWPGIMGSPQMKPTIKKFPRRDGGIATRTHLQPRKITLVGHVKGADRFGAMRLMDRLKSRMKAPVQVGARFPEGNRFWDCILMQVVDKSKPSASTQIPNMLQLIAPRGWGFSNVDLDLITSVTGQSGTATFASTVATNYEALPLITITFTAAAAGVHQLTIGNDALVAQLTINTPIAANDVLVIDSFNEELTLGGNPVDSDGPFPFFTESGEELGVSSDKSITYDITASYRAIWL